MAGHPRERVGGEDAASWRRGVVETRRRGERDGRDGRDDREETGDGRERASRPAGETAMVESLILAQDQRWRRA